MAGYIPRLFAHAVVTRSSKNQACCVVAQRSGVGLAIYRSRVQFPAGPLSRNIRQLSPASLRGRFIEYLLRLGVKA